MGTGGATTPGGTAERVGSVRVYRRGFCGMRGSTYGAPA